MLNEKLKEVLNSMKGNNKFENFVIEDIIDNVDNYENGLKYLGEVVECGCISGVVGSLITYNQTEFVFRNNFEDILEIYDEVKDDVNIEVDYNNLVWLAYETIVDRILWSNEIEEIKIEFEL